MSGADISVGDNCWFEAITEYKGARFTPRLSLGSRTSFSSGVHISAVLGVTIHADCLFGSNVYIGDHSHGSTKAGRVRLDLPPASRPLEDAGEIVIGDRVWVGDGAVILAGTRIGDGCVVGANSVVKGTFPAGSLIVGAPARVAGDLA
jgi:acetyltransferase-like isoleucine patch superfamily enzyme